MSSRWKSGECHTFSDWGNTKGSGRLSVFWIVSKLQLEPVSQNEEPFLERTSQGSQSGGPVRRVFDDLVWREFFSFDLPLVVPSVEFVEFLAQEFLESDSNRSNSEPNELPRTYNAHKLCLHAHLATSKGLSVAWKKKKAMSPNHDITGTKYRWGHEELHYVIELDIVAATDWTALYFFAMPLGFPGVEKRLTSSRAFRHRFDNCVAIYLITEHFTLQLRISPMNATEFAENSLPEHCSWVCSRFHW